ncbi:NAD(P)-binding domain-containing protein [Curtobacterium sp. 9128]|uniref:NADPH-dependent F420 reductase n=1 Tax=Curtobacterium sp. 9128 TaxID=1793722 RepID=UPI0032B29538
MPRNAPRGTALSGGMTTIGIIGAGNIGGQLARLAVQHGYDVAIANSRGPETLADLVSELGDRARAVTRDEAAAAGDLVVVTTPLAAIETIPVEPLVGKVVIDTNNYYPQRDGHIAALDDESTTTAELLQDRLPDARVVKAFNHIAAADLTTAGTPTGTAGRRALVVAGDDADAKRVVSDLLDEFGFDPVDIGPLAEGWRIQRDTPGYVKPYAAVELEQAVADAKRYRDM